MMNKYIRDIYIQASQLDEYTYKINTSDGREYLAFKNMYGHWFLYEGNDVDLVLDAVESGKLNLCGFGYTIDMCIKSVPTIQIKAWFGDWKYVSDEVAKRFLTTLYNVMNCKETEKMKVLKKHIKGIDPQRLLNI